MPLSPLEQQGLSFEAFADRQGCPYLPTENGTHVVFENGASIQVHDPLRGMAIVANPSEPPIDDTDELSLRRRHHYYRLKEEIEVTSWVKAKAKALEQLHYRGRTMVNGVSCSVPRPEPQLVLQLKAGADRCAVLRAKVVELEGHIAKLPSEIEKVKQAEDSQKHKEADIAADEALYREISQIAIELPEALRNSLAKQSLSV